MEGLWLLVGLVLGAVSGAVVMARFQHSRRAWSESAEVARLRTELDAAKSPVDALAGARDEMLALVKQGAGEELTQRGGELMKLVTAHLETATTKAEAGDEKRKQAVSDLVAPVNEMLGQVKERLDKVDRSREETHRELTAQLRALTSGQQEVARNAAVLERALRQPHTRGRWGELSLRRLAEAAGMSKLCDFVEQSHINDDGRILRPDMVVRLPLERVVVVDAKVPLSPFLDAMEATDEADRIEKLKLFARATRVHVRKLADKDYSSQFASAPDFVVMYLPGDHFLGGALEVDPELLEDAFARHVHIATPATLLALLRTVAYTFQREQVAADAQAIAKLGRELYDRISTLLGHIDKVSRCVNSLVDAQDHVVGSLERSVLPKARKFSELGVAGTEEQLPGVRPVPATARRVQAEELAAGGEIRELPPPSTEEAA
jgi:DNA recombination protein RmuC